MRTAILLSLTVLVLAATSVVASEGPKVGDEPLGVSADVVFLVDASGSVQTTDPDSSRRTVIRAIIDLALRRGGDRVAIYRFAGRRETAERKNDAETLPLVEVPKDARREEILERLHEAAGDAAEIFPGAMATDFNAAFEVGLQRILESRGDSKRPLWVVLLSDGDSEVERGATAHPAYVEEAQRRYGKTLTRYLNKAATDLLCESVLPAYDGPDRFFAAINVAAPEVTDGDALTSVASRGRGGEVLRVTDMPLRDLILPAFRTAPGALGRPVAKGIAYESLVLDGTIERTFRTCGRLGRTGLLVFAESSDFTVALARPDGEPLTEGSIEISGQGERYRVITVAGLPSGEYRLRLTSAKPVRAERIVYHEMDVVAEATLVDAHSPYRPGESVDLDVRLVDRSTGRVVTDADVLADVEIAVKVETPVGSVDVGEVSLADAAGGTARLTWTIPAGAERGGWIVDVRALGLRDPSGESGLRVENSGAARFEVRPALIASWNVAEIDVNGTAGLRGRPPAGSLPSGATIPVRLVQNDGDGSRTATLHYNAESGAWVASVDGLAQGDWRIESPAGARVEILPGDVRSLSVVHPTAAVPVPWQLIVMAVLLLLLLLAAIGIIRSMRRRRLVSVEDDATVEALDGEDALAARAAAIGVDESADGDIDEEDLLLDDEDVADFLAGMEGSWEADEEEEKPAAPASGEAVDIETLILEE